MTDVLERAHEHGLRALGLWPGPLDGVAAATSRAAAAEALANVQALARTAKRIVARRHHPDLAGAGGDRAEMQAAIAAETWLAAVQLADVWPPRSQAGERVARRRAGRVTVEVSATRVRIAYRGRI